MKKKVKVRGERKREKEKEKEKKQGRNKQGRSLEQCVCLFGEQLCSRHIWECRTLRATGGQTYRCYFIQN